MNELFQNSLFAGVTISLLAYLAGSILKKKFKLGIDIGSTTVKIAVLEGFLTKRCKNRERIRTFS